MLSDENRMAAHRRLHPPSTIVDKIHYARDVYQMLADEIRIQGLREPIDGNRKKVVPSVPAMLPIVVPDASCFSRSCCG